MVLALREHFIILNVFVSQTFTLMFGVLKPQ